ncbi:hypothetical protein GCM10011613_03960 [Cellvibrio zantedeschiae]|uniref:PEP-CTERM protein-sorting domain-containing protein n=1 Tax=Cellvibrio zantedeschiae TaxID=1237077 RepID=A0ABQ3APV0_9GAMM|nr:PEP-CTERM sorting domain-containing protein [Cellvibrio zantedeschiae]GGY63462.1 hypothetical protein GCM10011613_03960 [Cellvibrio zantedeschiae]
MEFYKYRLTQNPMLKISILLLSFLSSSSFASIIYSGIKNISFTAPTELSISNYSIDLANDASGTWDNIQFDLGNSGPERTFGASTAWPGSEVTLAYKSQLGIAQSYTNGGVMDGSFGSGTEILWYFDSLNGFDWGMFKNGTAYAGIMLNSFESNASFGYLYGWIQLKVDNFQNFDGRGATLTVVDWAYETTGKQIDIGQGVKVPEPSSWLLALLGFFFVCYRRPLRLN